MKKTILTAMVAALGLGFVGCGEETYTANYYMENKAELKKQLKICETADELSDRQEKNCKNAAMAHKGLIGRGESLD